MSLHKAKAHFTNAHNYAKTDFEKQLALGLAELASGLSARQNDLAATLRTLQQAIQAKRS